MVCIEESTVTRSSTITCLASHLDSVSHYKQQKLEQRPEMRLASGYNMLRGVSCHFYS